MSEGPKDGGDGAGAPLESTVASLATPKPSERARLLHEGDRLAGRYLLTRYIAAGGMGEVWEARDERLNELVAVKTIRPDSASADALKRFELEVKLARRVSHPNVCRVFDVGQHTTARGTEVTFLTMELLLGTTLSDVIARRGPLKPEEALVLLKQVALGLDAAHAAGVVHRDLKPSNIFLQEAGGSQSGVRVVITDFGIARSLRDESRATAEGGFLGTPAYMAPEQVQGGDVGPATDVYALGVVTFELLTGAFPFGGQTSIEIALARLSSPPRSLQSVGVMAPAHWQTALSRALALKPSDRFATATDFVAGLGGQPPQAPAPRPHDLRRRWVGSAVGVALVLAGLAAATSGLFKPKDDTLRWADLSTASTKNPQAIAKFREAIRLNKDRSGNPRIPLREAVAIDPDFAEAWVALAFEDARFARTRGETPGNGGTGSMREAQRLRHLLSDRDGEFLQAIEPILSSNPMRDEAVARLTEFLRKRPRDAPAWDALGDIQFGFFDNPEAAVTPYRRSRELDQSNVGVATEAVLLLERGETAEAIRILVECLRRSAATTCSEQLGRAYDIAGDCVAMERAAREGRHDPGLSLYLLLRALSGQGRNPDELVSIAELYGEEVARSFVGPVEARNELLDVMKNLKVYRELDFSTRIEFFHAKGEAEHEVDSLVESGDLASAVAVAKGRLLAEELRSRDLGAKRYLHTPGVLLAVQAGAVGGMTVADYRNAREDWLKRALGERVDGGLSAVESWSEVVGVFSVPSALEPLSPEDANSFFAMIQRSRGLPPMSKVLSGDLRLDTERLFNLGKLELSRGQLKAAEAIFRQLLVPCGNRFHPPYNYFLGVTQERLGDRQSACSSFAAVVKYWGNAKPRSVTAEKARAHAKELQCTEEIFSQPSPSADAGAH